MAVPTMEESALCSQLIERVKDYFQSAEHKKEFSKEIPLVYHGKDRRCCGRDQQAYQYGKLRVCDPGV